jgi:hypothetical protein
MATHMLGWGVDRVDRKPPRYTHDGCMVHVRETLQQHLYQVQLAYGAMSMCQRQEDIQSITVTVTTTCWLAKTAITYELRPVARSDRMALAQ